MAKVLTGKDLKDSTNKYYVNRTKLKWANYTTNGLDTTKNYVNLQYITLTGSMTGLNNKCIAYDQSLTGPTVLAYPLYGYSVFGNDAYISQSLLDTFNGNASIFEENKVITDVYINDMFDKKEVDESSPLIITDLIKLVNPNWNGSAGVPTGAYWIAGPYELFEAHWQDQGNNWNGVTKPLFWDSRNIDWSVAYCKVYPGSLPWETYTNFHLYMFPGYNATSTSRYSIKYKIGIMLIDYSNLNNSYSINFNGHLCIYKGYLGDTGADAWVVKDFEESQYKDWQLYGYPEEHIFALLHITQYLGPGSHWGFIAGDTLGTSFFMQPFDSQPTNDHNFSGITMHTIFCYIDGIMIYPNTLRSNNTITNKNYVLYPFSKNFRNLKTSLINSYPLTVHNTYPRSYSGEGVVSGVNGYSRATDSKYARITCTGGPSGMINTVYYNFNSASFSGLPTNVNITSMECSYKCKLNSAASYYNVKTISLCIGSNDTVIQSLTLDATTAIKYFTIGSSMFESTITRNNITSLKLKFELRPTTNTTRYANFYGSTLIINYTYTNDNNKKSPFDVNALMNDETYLDKKINIISLTDVPEGWTGTVNYSGPVNGTAFVSNIFTTGVSPYSGYDGYDGYSYDISAFPLYNSDNYLNAVCMIPMGPHYMPDYSAQTPL